MPVPYRRAPNRASRSPLTSPVRRKRSAFTLVELLVAMAVTLILILALSQAFALVGQVVAEGRATIEMAGSLRGVAHRLQEDLDGLTVPVRPWTDPGSALGYFEVIDGPSTDMDWNDDGVLANDSDAVSTILGDIDDVLAFTARSKGSPFVGQIDGVSIQSNLAEIVWWIQNASGNYDPEEPYTIYRRVLLIRPDLPNDSDNPERDWFFRNDYPRSPDGFDALQNDLQDFFLGANDLSLRIDHQVLADGRVQVHVRANSLADLTHRENRVARFQSRMRDFQQLMAGADQNGFPYPLDLDRSRSTSLYAMPQDGWRASEDVMLSNALAFDVRVFDPRARLRNSDNLGEAVGPGDPGYFAGFEPPITAADWPRYPNLTPPPPPPPEDAEPAWIGFGAFVDVGYGHSSRLGFDAPGVATSSDFSGIPHQLSGLRNVLARGSWPYVYCTWSTHYELGGPATDGFPSRWEDGEVVVDWEVGGVDGVSERRTSPPYPIPLRGIQVTIRAFEPDSRQGRQVAGISDFVPE